VEVTSRPESPVDSDAEKVQVAETQIMELQLKASLFEQLQEENRALRKRIEEVADRALEKKSESEAPSKAMVQLLTNVMKPFQEQMQHMQDQISEVSSKEPSIPISENQACLLQTLKSLLFHLVFSPQVQDWI
jgi:predicted transcriptional regulator